MNFLKGQSGLVFAALSLLAGGVAIYFMAFAGGGYSDVVDASSNRWFVDEGGKPFKHALSVGESIEIKSPEGKKAWPAELCFWTKDGKPKTEPTPVLLNRYLGKNEATFCPDCGRLVTPMNPGPNGANSAPPTKAEFDAQRK